MVHLSLSLSLSLCLSLYTVTNFNNGLEASSDSDDEDKLHIVEEDSLQEPDATANATAAAVAAAATVANGDKATPTDASHDASAVLAHNGSWNGGRPPEMAVRLLYMARSLHVLLKPEDRRVSVGVPIPSLVGLS